MDQSEERDLESFGESVEELVNRGTETVVTLLRDVKFGTGAFGIVCKAKRNGVPCAAKILHTFLCNASRAMEQFRQEIEFVREINHPNIVQCLGVHTDYAVSQMPIITDGINGL